MDNNISEKKNKPTIRTIVACAAVSAVLIGTPAICVATVGYNTQNSYENSAMVEYNNEQYYLSDLYKLTSESGEERICNLRTSVGLDIGLRPLHGIGPVITKDDSIYVDIDTKEEVAVKEYEETFGYSVQEVMDYFPFEEYGSKQRVVISQEDFESVLANHRIGKNK